MSAWDHGAIRVDEVGAGNLGPLLLAIDTATDRIVPVRRGDLERMGQEVERHILEGRVVP